MSKIIEGVNLFDKKYVKKKNQPISTRLKSAKGRRQASH
jgi:hypothetical protein